MIGGRGTAIDNPRLTAWLTTHVAGFRGPAVGTVVNGGNSNPVIRIASGTGQAYALRSRAPGVDPRAHAIDREYRRQLRVLTAGYRSRDDAPEPAIDWLISWLERHVDAYIVDDHPVSIAPAAPRIAAVLDWEVATLGVPGADSALLLLPWYLPPTPCGQVMAWYDDERHRLGEWTPPPRRTTASARARQLIESGILCGGGTWGSRKTSASS